MMGKGLVAGIFEATAPPKATSSGTRESWPEPLLMITKNRSRRNMSW